MHIISCFSRLIIYFTRCKHSQKIWSEENELYFVNKNYVKLFYLIYFNRRICSEIEGHIMQCNFNVDKKMYHTTKKTIYHNSLILETNFCIWLRLKNFVVLKTGIFLKLLINEQKLVFCEYRKCWMHVLCRRKQFFSRYCIHNFFCQTRDM